MDEHRFDRLTVQLGRIVTRRHVGGLLAALGLGAGLSPALETAAKKKRKKKKKPTACRPDCAGKACGDADGCGDTCKHGSCPGTQECVDGTCCTPSCTGKVCGSDGCGDNTHCGACETGKQCIDGACEVTCTPVCPSGRACTVDPRSAEGACTCTTHDECRAEQNPGGSNCLHAQGFSGPKICRCVVDPDDVGVRYEKDEPCAPGETCSECCTDQFCREIRYPESPGYICAPTPKDSYWPRFCCKPNGEKCIGWSQCCSGDCIPADYVDGYSLASRCMCTPPGTSCLTDLECCRGWCDVATQTCVCKSLEADCTKDSECCSQECDNTTNKCICSSEFCDCKLPAQRCDTDDECCRGLCIPGYQVCA